MNDDNSGRSGSCSGHGHCNNQGKCECDEHFSGEFCDVCSSDFHGPTCELYCSDRVVEHVIGYTSFEEPIVVGLSPVPPYIDTQGYDAEGHLLMNNDYQNPVSYVAGSVEVAAAGSDGRGEGGGHRELGFKSFYCSLPRQSSSDRLAFGAQIGVIGDTTTVMNGNSGQGGTAPDGSQYFSLEETGGFVTVTMDEVSVVGYPSLEMRAYVHVESAQWGSADRVRVWLSDAGRSGNARSGASCEPQTSASANEVVLLDGSPSRLVEGGSVGTFNPDMWQEYSAPIRDVSSDGFEFVAMHFGMRSNSRFERAWFDYFRIISSSSSCGGRGRCNDGEDAGSQCVCDDGYYGAHCRMFCDPVSTCGGHGACDSSLTPRAGRCNCYDNYYGSGCETYCTRAESCGGHGSCNPAGGCICDESWTGSRCDRHQPDGRLDAYLNIQSSSADKWMLFDVTLEILFLLIGLILTFDGFRRIRLTLFVVGFVVGGILGIVLASKSLYNANDGMNMWHGMMVPHPVYLIVAGLTLGCCLGAILAHMRAHPAPMFIVGFVCGVAVWMLGGEAFLGRQKCAGISACDELQLHGAWNRTDALAHLGEGAPVAQFGGRSWLFVVCGFVLSLLVGFSFLQPAQGTHYHISGVRKETTLAGVACLGAIALSGSLLVLLGRCIVDIDTHLGTHRAGLEGSGAAWASIGSKVHAGLAAILAVAGVVVQHRWRAKDYKVHRGRSTYCPAKEEISELDSICDGDVLRDRSLLSDRLYRTCCPPCAVYSREGLKEDTWTAFCWAWLCCCLYTNGRWQPRVAYEYHKPDIENQREMGKSELTVKSKVDGEPFSELENNAFASRDELLASVHWRHAFESMFPHALLTKGGFSLPVAVALISPEMEGTHDISDNETENGNDNENDFVICYTLADPNAAASTACGICCHWCDYNQHGFDLEQVAELYEILCPTPDWLNAIVRLAMIEADQRRQIEVESEVEVYTSRSKQGALMPGPEPEPELKSEQQLQRESLQRKAEEFRAKYQESSSDEEDNMQASVRAKKAHATADRLRLKRIVKKDAQIAQHAASHGRSFDQNDYEESEFHHTRPLKLSRRAAVLVLRWCLYCDLLPATCGHWTPDNSLRCNCVRLSR